MTDDRILTTSQVDAIRWGDSAYGSAGDAITDLCESHEELRKRLAAAEERAADLDRAWQVEHQGRVAAEERAEQATNLRAAADRDLRAVEAERDQAIRERDGAIARRDALGGSRFQRWTLRLWVHRRPGGEQRCR